MTLPDYSGYWRASEIIAQKAGALDPIAAGGSPFQQVGTNWEPREKQEKRITLCRFLSHLETYPKARLRLSSTSKTVLIISLQLRIYLSPASLVLAPR